MAGSTHTQWWDWPQRSFESVRIRATWCGAAIIVIGLSACGTPSTHSNGKSPTNPATMATCTQKQVHIVVSKGLAAGGNEGAVLTFTNISAIPCRLSGYPTVEAFEATGTPTTARHTPSGYLGGLYSQGSIPVVNLKPDGVASATIEAIDHPLDGGRRCPTYSHLLVGVPNEVPTVRVSAALPDEGTNLSACAGAPQVHPVVAGPTGNNG